MQADVCPRACAAPCADGLVKRGWEVTHVRKLSQVRLGTKAQMHGLRALRMVFAHGTLPLGRWACAPCSAATSLSSVPAAECDPVAGP